MNDARTQSVCKHCRRPKCEHDGIALFCRTKSVYQFEPVSEPASTGERFFRGDGVEEKVTYQSVTFEAARPSEPSAPPLELPGPTGEGSSGHSWIEPAPSPTPSVSTEQDYRYREVAELAMEYSGQQGNDISVLARAVLSLLAAPSVAGTQPTCDFCENKKCSHPLMWHKGQLVHHAFSKAGYYPCKRLAGAGRTDGLPK